MNPKIRDKMKKLVGKEEGIDILEFQPDELAKLNLGFDAATLSDDALAYFCTALPSKGPNLTIELFAPEDYAKESIRPFVGPAEELGFVILARNDGTFHVSNFDGSEVRLLPAWQISEGKKKAEKTYKGISNWLNALVRKEAKVAAYWQQKEEEGNAIAQNPSLKDEQGLTSFWRHLASCNVEGVLQEIEKGADVNYTPPKRRNPSLHYALENCGPEMVRCLLQAGADPFLAGDFGSNIREAAEALADVGVIGILDAMDIDKNPRS